jgi:hypothetical protein
MANQEASKGAKPGDRPFDDPAMAIGPKTAAVLVAAVQVVAAVRAGQHDAASRQPTPPRVAVIGAIADQMFRIAAVRQESGFQRRVEERDLRRRRRGNGDSQRNTLTLDQYHAL